MTSKKPALIKSPAQHTSVTSTARKEIAQKVLDSMGQGLSCFKACQAAKVPNSTFMRWLSEDQGLAERYARAREDLIEHIACEAIAIADEAVPHTKAGAYDSAAVQKQRLQVETRKWLLARLAPKKYGDRLELAGDKENPLQVQTIDASKLGTDVLAQIMAAKDAADRS